MTGMRALWGASALVLAAYAHAANAADEAGGPTAIEEVIVTATKRGENLQDVPGSVTALSASDIQRRGIADVETLALQVPNLNFGAQSGTTFVTIRGVGSTVDSGITEPAVATYIDGVFLPRATMGSMQQVDLERVEVLRGPQGTLYGRNATGGAINFISRSPTREFSGEASIGAGSRDAFSANAFVSGPVADGVFVRLSGGHAQQDGFVRVEPGGRRIADVDTDFVRFAVRLEPAEDFTADVFVKWESDKGANGYQQLQTPAVGPFVPLGTLQTTEPNRMVANGPFRNDRDTTVAGVTLNWTASEAINVRSVSGYVNHHSKVDFDADATSYGLFDAIGFVRPSDSISQEFDVFGEVGPVKYLVGAYYFEEDFFASIPVIFPNGLNTGDPASSLPPNTLSVQSVSERTKSYAAFADATWSLTDKLRLNGGFRINHEKKDFLWTAGVRIPGLGFLGLTDVPNKLGSDKFLPKLGIQYDLTDDVNVYASWQKGFKSGGHNLSLPTTYSPETLDSYEAGLKSQLFDRALTANVSAFHYKYRGLQVSNVVPPTTTQIENADARVYGLEADLSWRVNDAVRLNLATSFLDAKYTDFKSTDQAQPQLGLQDLSGQRVVRAPKFSATAGAEWRIALPTPVFSSLILRGDVLHSSRVVLRYFGTDADSQGAYTVANLSATLTDADEATTLRLFVNNVGDKVVKQSVTYIATIGAYMGQYSAPRTWGVQLSRRF